MAGAFPSLGANVLIPDLLAVRPGARAVLDRYGLRGCGGPQGPHETLGFFAQAHDVPLDRLLREIDSGLDSSPHGVVPDESPSWADAAYRPFFKAGIAVVLTLGATWGAYLLLRIALSGSFTAAGLHEVNAHGHAQIFGWVGLFVMGFAYQAFPRFKHAALALPGLARTSFYVMLVGLIVRSILEPLAGPFPAAGPLAVGAATLEVVAVILFAVVVTVTWRRAEKPLAVYDCYIATAVFWFVVQAVCEAIYLSATLAAPDRETLLGLVSTWQAPLREIQIHGFGLLMVLGVSQRIFPHFYGLSAPSPRLAVTALICLNAALVGEGAGLLLMRQADHAWAALWYASVLLLAGGVVLLVRDWHIFSQAPEADRSLKFLRAGYVWLFVSLAMLVLLPAYQFGLLPWLAPNSVGLGFSHAYYGAARHAVTVGFLSLMIVGVAAKVVPTLNGVNVRSMSVLWVPFALLNAGCALRVIAQILTDFTPAAYPVAGISGVLETLGLALWGAHLWAVMAGRFQEPGPELDAGTPIQPGHCVGVVLERRPELLDTFVAFGFRPLAQPWLRRTVARQVTIRQACRTLGVEEQQLLDALNNGSDCSPRDRLSLPVLS
jgi:hypothetical protein